MNNPLDAAAAVLRGLSNETGTNRPLTQAMQERKPPGLITEALSCDSISGPSPLLF